MRSVEDTAVAFDRACRRAEVAYAFMGGIAVAAWGQPRATTDVDALVALSREKVDALRRAVEMEGLRVDPRDMHDALRDGGHVSVFDEQSLFHVDVSLARTGEERDEVARAIDLPFSTGRIRVVRPEDVVAFKVLFGTPKDVQDARSVLARQGSALDDALLRATARRLKVLEQVEALLSERPPG